jgi:peptidyl-prolyl cis-trans isomerase SurA
MAGSWNVGALALAVLAAAAPRVAAQDSLTPPAVPDTTPAAGPARRDTSFVVDRVVAVVGSRPVLASQIDEKIFERQTQGVQLPKDEAGLRAAREEVLQEIIDEELLVQQAQRDTTIKVTEEEIAEGVTTQMRQIRRNFASEAEYRAELQKVGFQTPDEYRRWLSDQQRRAALQNRLIDKLRAEQKIKSVTPTDKETRAYFEEHKASFGKPPATISFRQIVVTPKASAESKERARLLADSIVAELRKGADFAVAARRFSADAGSRELGGELNWFRRGAMVPEFERVAFALKPGTISPPVESPFGYHIIQVQRVQPAEVQARHILVVPEVDSARIDSARALADSLYRLVGAGAAFDSLQRLHHDRSAERAADNVPVDKLPEDYAKAIGQADSGTVVPVFTLPGAGQRPQFVVCQVMARRPAGEFRYEDVRDQIASRLANQLAIRRYIDRLKSATYVEVRAQPAS